MNENADLVPAVLYLRFSSEMQRDSYSIEYQDRACREWCARYGRHVVASFKDEAYSATTRDRPAFQALLAECRSKQRRFSEVVFFHTWRFSRSMDDAPLFTEIERTGVKLISATELVDHGTPTGRLQRNISLVLGQYQIDQLREATAAAKRERAQGADPTTNASSAPWGYVRQEGRDAPGPVRAAVWKQSCERYATGTWSDGDIAVWLNEQGLRTCGNWGERPFSKDTIRAMLQNKYYAGYVPYRGMSDQYSENGKRKRASKKSVTWKLGTHEPIISVELWERCQQVRAQRGRHFVGRKPDGQHSYLLRGIAVCAGCGKPLGCSSASAGGTQAAYHCRSKERGYLCGARHVYVAQFKLLPDVEDMISRLKLPDEIIDRAIELSQSVETREKMTVRRDRLAQELKRLGQMYQKGGVDEAYYDTELKRIKADLADLEPVEPPQVERAALLIDSLADAWPLAEQHERNSILRAMLYAVVVDLDTGRVAEWKPKREFAPLFGVVANK